LKRGIKWLLKNDPLFDRFFLQPLIPAFRISELIFETRYISEMSKKILIIAAALLGFVFLTTLAIGEDKKPLPQEEKARQKMLKLEAANAFWRLKNSLEKDAFYSTRIRLNVWRSTALDAGTFDQAQYDEFKQQLYENSVNDSMKCYEEFILEENYYDANICLQTWRMHSKELGTYDKDKYEALKERLKQARIIKATREAEEKKAAKTEP
jgi:hypothetical protein